MEIANWDIGCDIEYLDPIEVFGWGNASSEQRSRKSWAGTYCVRQWWWYILGFSEG